MRDAVVDAVDRVVRQVLEVVEDRVVVLEDVGIDGRRQAAGDEPRRRVARRADPVVLARLHERDAVVRVGHVRGVDLAAGLILERSDPVIGGVGLAALGVAGPDDQVQLALAIPDLGDRGRARRATALATTGGEQQRHGAEQHGCAQVPHRLVSSSVSPSTPSLLARLNTCRRFQMRRTGLPWVSSASIEEVSRFCCVTTSCPPISSSTMYRVSGPM